MAFQAVPDCAQAIMVYGNSANEWTTTLWFEKAGFVNTDMVALADFLHAWAAAQVMPWLSSGFDLKHVRVIDQRTENAEAVLSTLSAAPGARTGDAAALNIACVVTFYTPGRGKSGRGRNYITGFSENDVGAKTVTEPAVVAGLQTAYENLITNVQTGPGWFWQVVSRYGNGVLRPTAISNNVSDAQVRNETLGTQRRRVPRN